LQLYNPSSHVTYRCPQCSTEPNYIANNGTRIFPNEIYTINNDLNTRYDIIDEIHTAVSCECRCGIIVPRSSMAEHLIDLAWGRDERKVVPERGEKSISNEMTFSQDLSDKEEIEKYLYELSLKVSKRLKEHDYLAGTISIKLRTGDFSTISRSKTLLGATNTAYEIYQIAKSLLSQSNTTKPVRLVGVKADKLQFQEDAWNQLDLGQIEIAWHKADTAMSKVHDKFGEGSILPARLLDSDDNPE
jgi:DNA polymerase-4